jgi:hypothetical protein
MTGYWVLNDFQESSNFEFRDTTGYWVLGTANDFQENSNFEFCDTTGYWVPPTIFKKIQILNSVTRLGTGYSKRFSRKFKF